MPQPQLWTAAGLAVELGRDPRTVIKALRHTPPDGRLGRRVAWRMASATKALAQVEQLYPRSSRGEEAAIDNVETVWSDLRRGFTSLEREKDINARRVMAQDVALLIHELEGALNALWRTPEDMLLFGPVRDRLIATAISELAKLCEAKLVDTPDGVQLVVP